MANYTYTNVSKQIKIGAGKIKGIFVSSAASTPKVIVYDDADSSGTNVLLAEFVPAGATFYPLGVDGAFFNRGLYISISGSITATVIYE